MQQYTEYIKYYNNKSKYTELKGGWWTIIMQKGTKFHFM